MHPNSKKIKNELKFFNYFKKFERIKVLDVNKTFDTKKLILDCHCVVTYGSSLAIDAIYHGKPSISLREHLYSNRNILLEPKNERELYSFLNQKNYKKIDKKKCYEYAFFKVNNGKKYRFFNIKNLRTGKFGNTNLNHYGNLLNIFIG